MSLKAPFFSNLLGCLTLLLSFAVAAGIEQLEDPYMSEGSEALEEWQFIEDVVDVPDYPDMGKLMKIHIDAPHANFDYFLDPQALSIGADDVVLYTIVIRSQTGANNIFFEGLRCDTREYKTYAYGVSGNRFYQVRGPQWKRIMQSGGTGLSYRRELVTMYFCDDVRNALSKEQILHRVQYPEDIPAENRNF